jgi:mRNA interferase YafQ
MYRIKTSKKFEKDSIRCINIEMNLSLLEETVNILAFDGYFPQKYKPHQLKGRWKGYWECHINPDWLLI